MQIYNFRLGLSRQQIYPTATQRKKENQRTPDFHRRNGDPRTETSVFIPQKAKPTNRFGDGRLSSAVRSLLLTA